MTSSKLPLTWPASLRGETSGLLLRMFRDPRVLESEMRGDLIAQLRQAVDLEPCIPEIRVLLGMALCVDLQAQECWSSCAKPRARLRTVLSLD